MILPDQGINKSKIIFISDDSKNDTIKSVNVNYSLVRNSRFLSPTLLDIIVKNFLLKDSQNLTLNLKVDKTEKDYNDDKFCNNWVGTDLENRNNGIFVRFIYNCLIIRQYCFNESTKINEELLEKYLNSESDKKKKIKVYKKKYSIVFATKNIKATCSTLSNEALDQLDKKTLKSLKQLIDIFKITIKVDDVSNEDLSKRLNMFIYCHAGEMFFYVKLEPEIKIELNFDNKFKFINFEVTPTFMSSQICDNYTMRSIYNQASVILPSKLMLKSNIFNNTSIINNAKNNSLKMSNLFTLKKRTKITKCKVEKLLKKYYVRIKRDVDASNYILELKNLIPKKIDETKSKNVFVLMSILIICVIVGFPLIIASIIYYYYMKKKANSEEIVKYNYQPKNTNDNVLLCKM